jgi:hypothetical protein
MAPQPLGLDPEDPLVKQAVFGVQMEDWLKGPIGSYVMNRVRQRLSALESQLKTIDPQKVMEVAKLQVEIKHWESFAGWIGDAIQMGYEAEATIDGERDAEDA